MVYHSICIYGIYYMHILSINTIQCYVSNKLLINSSKTTVINISTYDTSFPIFTLNNMIISPSIPPKT